MAPPRKLVRLTVTDDSTADVPLDESILKASVRHFKRNKKRLAALDKKARRISRVGKAPGRQIGSSYSKPSGKPKCQDKVACKSCGKVFKAGSPAHIAHDERFPLLCRRRA
jgi:hypothetical protein